MRHYKDCFCGNCRNDLDKKAGADMYLGGTLKMILPGELVKTPGGKKVKSLKPGDIAGVIYSYVSKPDGIYWMLEDGNFIKHIGGSFDFPYLEKSIAEKQAKKQAEIDAKVKERLANNDNPLYNAGKTLGNLIPDFDSIKYVILGLFVLAVLYFIAKIKS